MRANRILLLCILVSVFLGAGIANGQYCPSTYTNQTDDWITNVTLNTINNTTGQDGPDSYGDYTHLSTELVPGNTYTLSVTFFSEGTWTEHVRAWIDWNQDGDWDEADETWYLGSGIDATLTIDITVPMSAMGGSTRMRIIEQYATDPASPCDGGTGHSATYGETEDYTVQAGPHIPVYGACCNDATSICTNNVEILECLPPSRFFPDTLCSQLDPACGVVVGACCYMTEPCAVVTMLDCIAVAGEYRGDWTTCSPDPCIGTCCSLEDGTCEVTLPGLCDYPGVFTWGAISCEPNPCELACNTLSNNFSQLALPMEMNPPQSVSDEGANSISYDDFYAAERLICDLRWWGLNETASGSTCVRFPDDFIITFYDDAAGMPGDVVQSYVVTPLKEERISPYEGILFYEYSATLTPCLAQYSGWISIQGVLSGAGDCHFQWLGASEPGFGSSYENGIQRDYDLSMCLGATGDVLTGACCSDEYGGTCWEGYYIGGCLPPMRFLPGGTCAEFEPLCGQIAGACCLPNGDCQVLTSGDCANAGGSYAGNYVDCASVICTGACCDPITGACTEVGESVCYAQGGFYHGTGTDCGAIECSGACCDPDTGACTDLGEAGCNAQGGVFQGTGTDCATSVCTGACCDLNTGVCTDGAESACIAQGGSFQGMGTECATTICFGACCDPETGACVDISESACIAQGGNYQGTGTSCSPNPCPVSNDDCTDAMPLGALPASVIANTDGAQEDVTDFCGTSTPFKGLWYTVDGTGTTITATTCAVGTDFDTKIQVWCSGCNNLTCVGGDDDDTCPVASLSSRVEWCSQIGATYYILVGGFGSSTGTFELHVTEDGVPCSGGVECLPAGACCLGTGCLIVNEATCLAQGGTYFGDGTTCDPAGACCTTSGVCLITMEECCISGGGSFQGAGSDCDTALGACCTASGDCTIATEACCTFGGGAFQGVGSDCGLFSYPDAQCATPFEDISATGVALTLPDDGGEWVAVGFPFTFWGDTHTDIAVCSNGFLTFGTNLSALSEAPIPTATEPNDMIAVLWDDLAPHNGGTVHYQTLGTPGDRRFIAQWTDVPEYSNTGANTCQAVLYEATNCVELRYGAYSTTDYVAGVENQDGTEGTDVTAQVATGACIELCPQTTSNPCEGEICLTCLGDLSGDSIVNALDIDGFVASLLGVAADPACGDMNGDTVVDLTDLPLFVEALINETGPCPQPDGACCDAGECLGTMQMIECDALGGEWTVGGDCATFVCPPMGACCVATDCVGNMLQVECYALGGTFNAGEDCATFECLVEYCEPCFTNCDLPRPDCTSALSPDDWISNVTFNTINNETVNEPCPCSYTDFTSLATTVNVGQTYLLSVTVCSESQWVQFVTAYIDWNRNGTFEAAETYQVGSGIDPTVTMDITVPNDALVGPTVMRIIERWSSASVDPCEEYTYAEAEDYRLDIE